MTVLCPEYGKPMSKMCEGCDCFFDEPEYVVTDVYNYQAKPTRWYNRLDHLREVLGQFQGRERKQFPKEFLDQIKAEMENPGKATAVDVKSALGNLKFTKYMEDFYYILFAVTGEQPPYIPKQIEDKTVRMFKLTDQAYNQINKDKR